jgi:trimeric autotransporter adhesin
MKKFLALFAGVLMLAGCGSPTPTPTPTPSPDFGLALSSDTLNLAAGSSGTVTITVQGSNGFATTPEFTVSGAVLGTGSAKVASSVSGNAVTLNVGAGVSPGVYVLNFKGTSGSLVRSADLSLTVTSAIVPDFTLTAASSNVTIGAGANGNMDLNLLRTGGFSGAVSLAITGANVGVGADKIAATSGLNNSVFSVALSVGASVPAGSYTLTATGTAGGLTRTASFSVTVPGAGAGFSIAAPSSLNVVAGSPAKNVTITISRNGGFAGTIDFVLEGSPILGAVGPGKINGSAVSSTTNSATMVLTVDAAVPAGTYNLTVRGSNAGTSSTTGLTLIVAAAGTIGFDDSAVTYSLRGRIGEQFTYLCPANVPLTKSVWGSDVYTDDSRICTAAVHAGKITKVAGGVVTIEIFAGLTGANSYLGLLRNEVSSFSYGTWSGSYIFK